MTPGETLTLRVERPVAGGRMLARHEGAIVMVAGALPDEVVHARVERVQRGTVWAVVTRVAESSADRVGDPNPCGGLVFAHARYERQLTLKRQIIEDAFRRIARFQLERELRVAPSPADGYRMRARLHVRAGRIGFFMEGTHDICDVATTGQLLPATGKVLAAAAEPLGRAAAAVQVVELAENRDASERVVHLGLGRDGDPSGLAPLTSVEGLTGVSYSHHGSPRVRVLSGDRWVRDRFIRGDLRWELAREGRAFFQGNRYLLDPLVDAVVGATHPGAVADLYAGVGLFAVAAAAQGRGPVLAVEGDPLAAGDLRRNAADWRARLEARHQPVEDYLQRRRGAAPQTIVVDPPRTGLSRRATDGILAAAPPRLVYVSCDVPTLARDARALMDAGYRLTALEAFDLFPNTAHVETVAVLDR